MHVDIDFLFLNHAYTVKDFLRSIHSGIHPWSRPIRFKTTDKLEGSLWGMQRKDILCLINDELVPIDEKTLSPLQQPPEKPDGFLDRPLAQGLLLGFAIGLVAILLTL